MHRVVDRAREAARGPHRVELLVAADQEGGQVQRLRGPGFDEIPSARRQAKLDDAELTDRAATWGRQLRRAGVDADLAPVADVVPAGQEEVNRPIGRLGRGFGPDPEVVAAKATAVVKGLDRAGVASAVKHFPGLGRVRGNTDFEAEVVDRETGRHDPTLRSFAAPLAAGADMVMMSSASYARIDPDRRAAFSGLVISDLVRGDLGYSGVVISDDLAARGVGDLPPGTRALRFLRAGGDLVIVGDPGLAPAMAKAVRAAATDDPAFAARLQQAVARVLALKQRRGLSRC